MKGYELINMTIQEIRRRLYIPLNVTYANHATSWMLVKSVIDRLKSSLKKKVPLLYHFNIFPVKNK